MIPDIFKPEPIEVLNAIWAQSKGGKIYLPTLDDRSYWSEGNSWRPDNVGSSFFDRDDEVDYYFTPLKYDGKRQRQFVGNPGVIYADLDGNHQEDYGDMPPSVAIASGTPGHYHAYWFLTEPADALVWEQYAQGWSQEIGADPAGWDITQVLRVPDTINHKTGNRVQVVRFMPDRTYPLHAFPKATIKPSLARKGRPTRSVSTRATLLEDGFKNDTLPLTARYWLTATKEEIQALGKIDRSAIMWQVEKSLISSGFSIEETYQLMYFAAINKWQGQPGKLWSEIIKAAS